jgi:hypothetical protein
MSLVKLLKEDKNTILSDSKVKLSKGMVYHLENKIPITENIFRQGSDKFFKLFNEARKIHKKGLLNDLSEIDKWFLNTDLGKVGIYEGKKVYLDYPMLMTEAEYKGKEVKLNKPMRSTGPKKYQVYVKNDKGNVIKVNFGDAKGGLSSKIKDPEARKAFASRHDCKNKKDRTKASYWSCNLPKYASALGMGENMNTYW